MRNRFTSTDDLMRAEQWLTTYLLNRKPPITGRILQSTRLTDLIYRSFLSDETERKGKNGKEIPPDLSKLEQDLFCSLLSPVLRKNDPHTVHLRERMFHQPILEHVFRDDRFDELKGLCENKELPSYAAASTFCDVLQTELPNIQTDIPKLRYLSVIETLSKQAEVTIAEVQQQKVQATPERLLALYNRIDRKLSQMKNLEEKLRQGALRYMQIASDILDNALSAALEQARETTSILLAWGTNDGEMKNILINRELLKHVKNSEELKRIASTLGKYRQILAARRKNGYDYGRGEKYDLTTGNDITNCLSSELALLGTPETEILFLRKYNRKQLTQYRKRSAVVKGKGDIIVLIDESSSTRNVAGWAKAFALALLDIAAKEKRKFALIHFSSASQIKTDLFEPDRYQTSDILKAAEQFFGGGTDFEALLKEAFRLMKNGYENADITIITDGECRLSDDFAEQCKETLSRHRATVTGILLDKGKPCGETLLPFCEYIYHSKDLTEDEIAVRILNDKAC